MKKAAVILSGCGYLDGSEIYEATLMFLELDKQDIVYECLAPNKSLNKQVNYVNQMEEEISRNCLNEAARLARGAVKDIKEADPAEYDMLFVPGGFGAALNLCDFAETGNEMTVDADVEKFAQAFVSSDKPVGFICIAPVIVAKLYPEGVKLTIGRDPSIAQLIQMMGGEHVEADETDCVIDEEHKVVTTPAYMLGERISKVHQGITKLVSAVVEMA